MCGSLRVVMNHRLHLRQSLILFGWSPLVLLGVSSCRGHSASSSVPQKSSQPFVQQQAQTRIETDQEKSCRTFVQEFYDWYFDRLNNVKDKVAHRGISSDDVVRLKPEALAARLRRLLREDKEASSRNSGEVVGLDFDPYINAQDWEGNYWVKSVTVQGGRCSAAVWGTDSGAKRDIVNPELDFANDSWVFANFHYPGSAVSRDENLIDMLIGLRDERKHPQKKAP